MLLLALAGACHHRAATRNAAGADTPSTLAAWPALASSARPWAIWWWPGSAVDDREIEAHLDRYAAAGLGGVHVVPIYGVRGRRGARRCRS